MHRPPRELNYDQPLVRVRWSLSTKIFIALAMVIVAFGAVGYVGTLRMNALRMNVKLVREGVLPVTDELSALYRDLKVYEQELTSPDLARLRSYFPRFKPFRGVRTLEERINALAVQYDLPPAETRYLGKLGEKLRASRKSSDVWQSLTGRRSNALQLALRTVDTSRTNEAVYDALAKTFVGYLNAERPREAFLLKAELASIILRIRSDVGFVRREFRRLIREVDDTSRAMESESVLVLSVATGTALFIALLVMVWIAFTLRPLSRLQEGVRQVARGRFVAVPIESNDEIGQLADEFNRMGVSLSERDRLLAIQREELLRSERLATIGKMSSQITHEIRNPLSSMGLNSELLGDELNDLQKLVGPERLSESQGLVSAIRGEVDRLTEVTEQYLKFARLPKPKTNTENINQIVRDLLDFMSQEFQRNNVKVDTSLDVQLPLVLLDIGQIRQSILNLLRNAIEAVDSNGTVVITTTFDAGAITLTIQDTGEGMTPEVVERVFDPFFTTKASGTGLGLSMVQQIIQEHGGAIECESVLGTGTTFIVTLPRIESAGSNNHTV